MKNAWIPVIVLCAACSTTSPSPNSGGSCLPDPSCCTPGCCDDDPDCCATKSVAATAPTASTVRTESTPCCAPGSDCCVVAAAGTR